MITLYTSSTPNGYGCSIALEEMGLPYEIYQVKNSQGEQKSPWFTKINPNGRIPALVDHDAGVTVWKSAAIRLYLAEKTGMLMPTDPQRRWAAHSWILLTNSGVSTNQSQANIFYRFWPEKLPSVISRFRNETRRLYSVIDGHLKDHEYLADEYSIADCGLWPWIRISDYGDISLDEYPHIKEWFERVGQRPAVQRGGVTPPLSTATEEEKYAGAQKMLMV